jgi:hypothetical protein
VATTSFVYNQQKYRRIKGSSDLTAATIKALLIKGDGTFVVAELDKDHDTVAQVLTAAAELTATGYSGGPGGTSRKTVAGTIAGPDDTNDRGDLALASAAFGAMSAGGPVKAILYYEHISGSDDTLNIPIGVVYDSAAGDLMVLNGGTVDLPATTFRLA